MAIYRFSEMLLEESRMLASPTEAQPPEKRVLVFMTVFPSQGPPNVFCQVHQMQQQSKSIKLPETLPIFEKQHLSPWLTFSAS